jgi:hypothetical protein
MENTLHDQDCHQKCHRNGLMDKISVLIGDSSEF